MSDDAKIAKLARELADTLMRFAHDREDMQKKKIALLHTELCALRRDELAAPPAESGQTLTAPGANAGDQTQELGAEA